MKVIDDKILHFEIRGAGKRTSFCRARLLEHEGTYGVLLTELEGEPHMSITNAAEEAHFAAYQAFRPLMVLPHKAGTASPNKVTFIEHWVRDKEQTFDLVRFGYLSQAGFSQVTWKPLDEWQRSLIADILPFEREKRDASEPRAGDVAGAPIAGNPSGTCRRCNRHLTDPASRAVGMGAVCASKAAAEETKDERDTRDGGVQGGAGQSPKRRGPGH